MTGEVSPASNSARANERPPELRASHADRDRVVEVLRIAAGDGRLTAEELDQRLETALSARTLGELAMLTTDLPAAQTHAGEIALPEARDLIRIECGSGSTKRDGQWAVPQRMEVSVTSGSVKLDFRDAAITRRTLAVDAEVASGALVLVTRPGIVVDADDVSVGSGSVRVKAHAAATATPVILRIQVSGSVRSGAIIARPPRRTLLQWLLRRPKN